MDESSYFLEADWNSTASGTDLVQGRSSSIYPQGQEQTAQALTVEQLGSYGKGAFIYAGSKVRLRFKTHKLLGTYTGDLAQSNNFDPSEQTTFTIVPVSSSLCTYPLTSTTDPRSLSPSEWASSFTMGCRDHGGFLTALGLLSISLTLTLHT